MSTRRAHCLLVASLSPSTLCWSLVVLLRNKSPQTFKFGFLGRTFMSNQPRFTFCTWQCHWMCSKLFTLWLKPTWNEEWKSPSKITILYSSYKDYFSFERGMKYFVSSSIPTISCVFSYYDHCAFEEIWFKVWCSFFTNEFFKLPSSLLCVLCLHYPS